MHHGGNAISVPFLVQQVSSHRISTRAADRGTRRRRSDVRNIRSATESGRAVPNAHCSEALFEYLAVGGHDRPAPAPTLQSLDLLGDGTLVADHVAGLSGNADQGRSRSEPRSSAMVAMLRSRWRKSPCPAICFKKSYG